MIIKVSGHQYWRFLEVASMVVTWWVVAFLRSDRGSLGGLHKAQNLTEIELKEALLVVLILTKSHTNAWISWWVIAVTRNWGDVVTMYNDIKASLTINSGEITSWRKDRHIRQILSIFHSAMEFLFHQMQASVGAHSTSVISHGNFLHYASLFLPTVPQ